MAYLPTHGLVTALAWTLLCTGLVLRYWIGKRRFKRRTIAGLQQFENYPIALVTLIGEQLVKWLSTLCLLAGLILLVMT